MPSMSTVHDFPPTAASRSNTTTRVNPRSASVRAIVNPAGPPPRIAIESVDCDPILDAFRADADALDAGAPESDALDAGAPESDALDIDGEDIDGEDIDGEDIDGEDIDGEVDDEDAAAGAVGGAEVA